MRVVIVFSFFLCQYFVIPIGLRAQKQVKLVLPTELDNNAQFSLISFTDPFWKTVVSGDKYTFHYVENPQNSIILRKDKPGTISKYQLFTTLPRGQIFQIKDIQNVAYTTRKEALKNIFVGEVYMEMGKKDQLFVSYTSESNFLAFRRGIKESARDSIFVDNLPFDEAMNSILYASGFIDSTENEFAIPYNSVYLDARIQKIRLNYLMHYRIYSMEAEINWKFRDLITSEILYDTTTKTRSDPIPIYDITEPILYPVFRNCLEYAIVQLMSSDGLYSILKPETYSIESIKQSKPQRAVSEADSIAGDLEKISESLVFVRGTNNQGSGILISNNGLVLSCLHKSGITGKEIEVETQSSEKIKGKVIETVPYLNLALIQLESNPNIPALNIFNAASPKVSKNVFASYILSDAAEGLSVSRGIVSAVRKQLDYDIIQSDVKISSDASGGLLLNEYFIPVALLNNKLYGIGVEGISFAIPFKYVIEAFNLSLTMD